MHPPTDQAMEALWTPDPERRRGTALTAFAHSAGFDLERDGYDTLHRWSVEHADEFWRAVVAHVGGIAQLGATYMTGDPSRPAPGMSFFPHGTINLAENYLRHRTGRGSETALWYRGEDRVASSMTWDELWDAVGRTQAALVGSGVQPGDRVATMLPNGPEAIIVFLAAAAIGAVYSSTSPDFGRDGVLDRFGQIDPRVLVVTDGYAYGGKRHDITTKAAEIAAGLPGLSQVVMVPYGDEVSSAATIAGAVTWDDWTGPHQGTAPTFAPLPFDHPIYILYSSGTTGRPKCIVHRTGGVLLKHWSELTLHCDLRPGDRMFYFTTTGWMMWNWLVSGLSAGVSLVLYDGSPFHPGPTRLFDLAEELGPRLFGVSAKYIESVLKEGLAPARTHDLGTVEIMTSTGSPLAPEGFEYVYESIGRDLHLASFSGGTDICGCFVTGNPNAPVYAGQIQAPALGVDVDVADPAGRSVAAPGQGELICRNAIPSMPLQFWSDPDDARYHAAYFEQIPGVWHHGDFASWTAQGGMIISGRSDATLNPGGVRIGTAEIYRQVDLVDEVLESVVVGQQHEGDTRVVLFVRLRDGLELNEDLSDRIRRTIRTGASPRHVPAVVAQVPTIPRTRSGKLVELAIRDVIHGRAVTNAEAIDDPLALDAFRDHPALA